MSIPVTFLEQGGQQASDVAALLAEFLSQARSSLHIAIYDFRLSPTVAEPVVNALRQRAAAGVEVRLVYDAGKPGKQPSPQGDPKPPGSANFVQALGQGIQVKPITGGDPVQPRLMHHKYIVRDGGTPQAALWTGSANFTDDSWTLQENNLLQIASPELCGFYETDFEELWSRGDIATTGTNDRGTVQVGSSSIDVAFAPGEGQNIDHDLAHHVLNARRRIKICSMLITSGPLLGALNDVRHHGRLAEYGGIYDRTQMESVFQQWQGQPSAWKIQAFEQAVAGLAGKASTPYTPSSQHDFMHNKILLVDDTVITGSYNLSRSAEENAENILLIHDPEVAERYNAYIDHLVQKYGAVTR